MKKRVTIWGIIPNPVYGMVLWIILWLSYPNVLTAQQPSYATKIRKVSIEQGLSNRFVRRVFQDSKGFIWLATNYGLNRYDGYEFKLYTKENQGLTSNAIYSVYEDADARLWVTYFDVNGWHLNEIDIIDLVTGEVSSFDEKFKDKFDFQAKNIFDIYQVNTNSIFVLTKDKQVIEISKGYQQKERFELPYPAHTLHKILCTDDMIWVICQDAILEYTRTGIFIKETPINFASILDLYLEEGNLHGFAKDLDGNLIVFKKKFKQELELQALPSFLENIQELNPSSNLQIAPNGLIWYHDRVQSKILNTAGEVVFDFSSYLPERTIYSVFFDDNDIIWIATTDGVYILTITSNKFDTYLSQNNFKPNSTSFSTRGIIEDGMGNLYVNTYAQRQKINLKTGTHQKEGKEEDYPELGILKDKDGYLWFCGESTVVERLDLTTNTYQDYDCGYTNQQGIKNLRPMNTTLHQDQNGRIWMGGNDGLFYLDTATQTFIKNTLYGTDGTFQEINTSRIYQMLEDTSMHCLWIATTSGLYGYNYKKQLVFSHYHIRGRGRYNLPHNYIYCIHKDKKEDNIYWLGTKGGGLIRFNPYHPTEPVRDHYTVATGLSDNVIYSIQEDTFSNLWMGSNYGLMQFSKTSEWVKTYLPKDGVTHEEFNSLSSYVGEDGRFYYGTVNGINAFYPKDFAAKEVCETPLHITTIQQMDALKGVVEDKTQAYWQQGKLILQPGDNFFSIKLALLDYVNPKDNGYAYKIKEIDEDWKYTTNNEIRFNQMPAGKYTILIKGQGPDGIWSMNRIAIPIEVITPFYKTYTFGALLLFLLSIFVLIYIKLKEHFFEQSTKRLEREVNIRTQAYKEAKEQAEKSSQAKAEFLSVMSHEIRTPMNAVVNMTNFLLQDNPKESQVENLNVLKFSANNLLAIINDVLDFNKIESGKIVFEAIPFDMKRLMDSIKYSMEAYAKDKSILLKTVADVSFEQLLIGDPSRLTQVLNNLISNAIKFTDQGEVWFKISTVSETEDSIILCFEVIDTGIGIAKDKQGHIFKMFTQASSDTTRKFGGTGLGLAISQKLINLQGSEIVLESELGKGAKFSFELEFLKGEKVGSQQQMIQKQETVSAINNASVLVVEDNLINVMVVKKFLQKWGVNITRAADGVEAIEAIKNYQFDVILMDIHMPNMDGYTASKHIRKMPGEYYQQVPIIALTASALADDRNKVFDSGMNDIVVKPFIPSELYAMLCKYIEKASA